jgi:hypothetical protein
LIPLFFESAVLVLQRYEKEMESNRPAVFPSLLPASAEERSAPTNTLVQLAYTIAGLFVILQQSRRRGGSGHSGGAC